MFSHKIVFLTLKMKKKQQLSMSDYPFSNWNDFCNAVKESLTTEDYAVKFPNYAKMIGTHGSKIDIQITKQLLAEKNDAQEGLDNLIKAVVDGSHYAKDSYYSVRDMIKLLMTHGATVTEDHTEFLLKPSFENFEDDASNCSGRALLLQLFGSAKAKLESVQSLYWEYIPGYEQIPNDITNKLYINAFHLNLKHQIEQYSKNHAEDDVEGIIYLGFL